MQSRVKLMANKSLIKLLYSCKHLATATDTLTGYYPAKSEFMLVFSSTIFSSIILYTMISYHYIR